MTLKMYLKKYGLAQAEKVALAAGTNMANYKLIMRGGSVSRVLAERLSQATYGEVSELEILYVERYEGM